MNHSIGAIPDEPTATRTAQCIAAYDWSRDISSELLAWIESIFTIVAVRPVTGVAAGPLINSRGAWPRVRQRVARALERRDTGGSGLSLIVRGGTDGAADDAFPYNVEIVCNLQSSQRLSAQIAVAEDLVPSAASVRHSLEASLFGLVGPAYGHGWHMPTIFGPELYLSSVGVQPAGFSFEDVRRYTDRITLWRDRLSSGFRPSQGFLREVYPTNYLLPAHMSRVVVKRTLDDICREYGRISSVATAGSLIRWELDELQLSEVANLLETSGLILSSPVAPVR